MNKVYIIPAPGKKVRKPETKLHLREEGELVIKTPFWNRRIKEGDVLVKNPESEIKKDEKSEKLPAKQGDKQ